MKTKLCAQTGRESLKTCGYAILHPAGSFGYFARTRKEALIIRERMVVTIIRTLNNYSRHFNWPPGAKRRVRKNILIRRLKEVV